VLAIDTSAVIGFIERQDPPVVETLTTQVAPAVLLSFVEAELLHGVAAATADAPARQRTLGVYHQLTTLADPVPERAAVVEYYGQVSGYASRTANRSGQNDRWIIAEAVAMNATIFVTQDDRQAALMKEWSESVGRSITTHTC